MADIHDNIVWPGWETVGLLGRGNFGAVYEIERDMLGEKEKAALKVITIPQNSSDIDELYSEGYDDASITSTFQTYLKNIVAEYSLMRKMNGSANVVNCDDIRYVQHDDGIGWDIFIKMELLTPLTKSLEKSISDEQVAQIGADICKALILCNKHNIIHRDIKPANIFVSENGDYKLGDFGIAKTVEKTSGGTKIGTYEYMAPEVYHDQPYGRTVDIYSLGMVLYWLLNERRTPFLKTPPSLPTSTEKEQARKRRFGGEPIPAPAHGSDELKRIVLKACAFDSKDRYQSAEEMLVELCALDSGSQAARHEAEQVAEKENEGSFNRSDTISEEETIGAFGRKGDQKPPETAPTGNGTKRNNLLPIVLIMMCLLVSGILLVNYIQDKENKVGIYTVTLTAVSDSKVYDGTPLRNSTIKSSGLASDDHTMMAEYVVFDDQGNELEGDPINVGVYSKKISNIHIWDGNKEITEQYQITTVDGYLTITARDLIVPPSSESTDLRLMGPFSPGRFYFVNGASVQIPEGFSDTNTGGDYRSANTDGYKYVFYNSEYDMTITLSEDYVSTYRDTGKYGVSDYELLSTLLEELIDVRGTPSWRSLFPEYFKLTGYLGTSIYYTYGVIDNNVLYIIDFYYPENNRQYCDRVVEVTEASFFGASGQQVTSITSSKPSAKDLDEINANIVYPASESYYLDAYETKYVQSQTGKGGVNYFIDPDSSKNIWRDGNFGVVYNNTEAIVIARSPAGWSCVIFPSLNCAGWINSNYLVS